MRKIIVVDGKLMAYDPERPLEVPVPFDPAEPYANLPDKEKNRLAFQSLMFHLGQIEDKRHDKGKRHKLINVLILTIFGVLRGHTDFVNMVDDLKYEEEYFTKLLNLKHGIPSHDVFSAVFRMIDSEKFMMVFIDWMYSIAAIKGKHIAIDGKAVRAACDKAHSQNMPYVLNAFLTEEKIVIGQMLIDSKKNEISGIPKLLEYLDIEGAVVTIDAIGCQRTICSVIIGKGAQFVLPVKENQPALHEAILLYMEDAYKQKMKEDEMVKGYAAKAIFNFPKPWNEIVEVYEETEPKNNHGRQERRIYVVSSNTECVDKNLWPHVKMIGMTIRERTVIKYDKKGNDISETAVEVNTWIISEQMKARKFGMICRRHWAIEDSLHYTLDISFKEDGSTANKDNALENLAQIRKICFNYTNLDPHLKDKPKKRAFWYYRHHPEAVIDLLFNGIPEHI